MSERAARRPSFAPVALLVHPEVIPDLHNVGPERAALVQLLRRHVAPLRHDAGGGYARPDELAQRRQHKRPTDALPARERSNAHKLEARRSTVAVEARGD